jgi:hypothetical protein
VRSTVLVSFVFFFCSRLICQTLIGGHKKLSLCQNLEVILTSLSMYHPNYKLC